MTGIKRRKEWKGIGNQLGNKHLSMKSFFNFKEAVRLLFLRKIRGKRSTITLRSLRGGWDSSCIQAG